MAKEIWFNLPSKNIEKSRAFYNSIGFDQHPHHLHSPNMIALVIGDQKVMVMLFTEAHFKGFTKSEIPDTQKTSQLMISISAESREEVDAFAKKVAGAKGNVFAAPSEIDGWMYGMAFADPDGHQWNMLYMDMEKMPK